MMVHPGVSPTGRYKVLESVRGFMRGQEITLPQGVADALLRRRGGPYIQAIGAPQAKRKKRKRVRKDDESDTPSDTDEQSSESLGD